MEILSVQESVTGESPPLFVKKKTETPELPQQKEGSPPAELPGTKVKADEENLKAVVERVNNFLKNMQYSLQFTVDRKNKEVVVKVLDADGKLIRQIPPEEMVALSRRLGASNGMILNEILG
jgi:flagellar protein FlaG